MRNEACKEWGVAARSAVVVLGLAALVMGARALAAELSALDGGIEADASSSDPAARGKYVLYAAGCVACHTAQGDDATPLAGGHELQTDFGTFYSPNITPDVETGIGGWTLEQFTEAVRNGRAPDGSYYYPAFPYTSYAGMRDADVEDLFTYLQGLEPVRQTATPHDLGFPYSQRSMLGAWRWMHFDPEDRAEGAESRGAYLVNTLGHCGECHTPRGWLGGLKSGRHLEGGQSGTGGRAPDITPNGNLGRWSRSQLILFLTTGFYPDGDVAGGGMGDVIYDSLALLSEEDIEAMADYLQSRE